MKIAEAYDLGVIGGDETPAARRAPAGIGAVSRPVGRARAWSHEPTLPPALRGSLSLIAPGLGQLVRGEWARGLFYASGFGFMAALIWALLETFDRLVPTLDLLGYTPAVALWWLAAAYALAAALHVGAVLGAAGPDAGGRWRSPVLPGLASAILPGWGQLLNGDRVRAGLFLSGVWLAAAAWIVGSTTASSFLNGFLPAVSPWEESLRRPFIVWTAQITAPLLLWAVSVYDAAASAAGRREAPLSS